MPNHKTYRRATYHRQAYRAYQTTTPTAVNTLPLYGSPGIDFDLRLPIQRVVDFEDEPTLPYGLCRWQNAEETFTNLPRG